MLLGADWLGVLTEPLSYQFMVKAIAVGAAAALVCSVLSCYLALRGWALMGDALAHSVLPGVVVAFILGLPFALGAVVAAAIAVVGIGAVRAGTRLKEDASIGVVFTAMFALGLLLKSKLPAGVDFQSILLGNLLGISDGDALQCFAIAAAVLLVVALTWRDLVAVSFDPAHARAIGLPVGMLTGLLLGLTAAATVAGLQAVGAALVVAMLITPGATACLLTDRFGRMVWIAAAVGVGSAVVGAYASYFVRGATTGGCIITLQAAVFVAALIVAPRHGLIAARRASLRLRADPRAAALAAEGVGT
ncbi:MAG: metal ABC transporter permease [Phycisphaeraceae bacterium]|nr:metal ABC transporter permease [Phycisphaeraceae bacterium]